MTKTMMPDAKFYIARRDTRWDVYPQAEPPSACAHDWNGFWAFDARIGWFKTPTSFVCLRQVTREEAERFAKSEAASN